MKVILTEKVKSLGNVGEILTVSAGYARNFLLPRKLAVIADESNKKVLEDQKRRVMKKVNEEKSKAEAIAKSLKTLTLDFTRRVGANGKLFGMITSQELSKILADKGIDVERRLLEITVPIKSLGTFEVKARLFTGVEEKFKVKVSMDPAQAEELKKREELAKKRKAKGETAEGAETTEVQAAAEGAEVEVTEAPKEKKVTKAKGKSKKTETAE